MWIGLAAGRIPADADLLVKKYCTPNWSASVNVTSATVASIATCNRGRSISRSARSIDPVILLIGIDDDGVVGSVGRDTHVLEHTARLTVG